MLFAGLRQMRLYGLHERRLASIRRLQAHDHVEHVSGTGAIMRYMCERIGQRQWLPCEALSLCRGQRHARSCQRQVLWHANSDQRCHNAQICVLLHTRCVSMRGMCAIAPEAIARVAEWCRGKNSLQTLCTDFPFIMPGSMSRRQALYFFTPRR